MQQVFRLVLVTLLFTLVGLGRAMSGAAQELDPTDPVAIANAVVDAIRADDVGRVLSFMPEGTQAQAAEVVEQGDSHPQYSNFRQALGFGSVPAELLTPDVRYSGSGANVMLGSTAAGDRWVVRLAWSGARWFYNGAATLTDEAFLEGDESPTPQMLRAAIADGSEGVVGRLLVLGASPTSEIGGGTLLALAARAGSADAVRSLLDAGANASAGGEAGPPILHGALQESTEIFDMLRLAGAPLPEADANGRALLLYGSEGGSEAVVRTILEAGADLDARGNGGMTPLMLAARGGHAGAVRTLIEFGADVNATRSPDDEEWTALLYAALDGSVETVQALLEAGADVNQGAEEFSVLFGAVGSGSLETLEVLLGAGARVDVTNDRGETPLALSIERNEEDMAARLRAAGAER